MNEVANPLQAHGFKISLSLTLRLTFFLETTKSDIYIGTEQQKHLLKNISIMTPRFPPNEIHSFELNNL